MPIKHKFQSGRADDGDVGAIQPSHWNGDHDLTGLLAALDDVSPAANTVLTFDEQQQPLLMPKSQLVPLNSPAFTGVPTAPTAPVGTNSAQIATMAAIANAISALLGGAPAALDTLKELADALNDDASFAATITNQLALKAPLASPSLTGTPTAPTVAGTTDATTKIATTAFVQAVAALLAPLASPAFTGNPTAPTPTAGDSDTSIATTAFVQTALAGVTDPFIRNAIDNGNFEVWQRGISTPTTHTAGNRIFNADRWFVRPQGASVTSTRSAAVPASAVTRYSKAITGATSVTTVDLGQRLMSDRIPAIKRTVTFQFWVLNNTGGAFTPTLLLGTPAAVDDFTTVANRLTQALQSCANGAWTQVSYTVDISGYTNLANGLEVVLQIPSGSMNSGAKSVQIAEAQLAPRSGVTNFMAEKREHTLLNCFRHYQKTFPESVTPAQNASFLSSGITLGSTGTAAGCASTTWIFPVEMAGNPVATTYNPSAANANWRDLIAGTDVTVGTDASRKGCRFTLNGTCVDQHAHAIHATFEYEP
ncbi:hypothetical protein IVB14_24370 [Bradyrhizobium sp. 180]|uniref:hypothetical protein n=1 Tax=Bradyrhizobium sp. 180 TaxID=2782650 RepID=UPI001FF7E434|nr:hypothetical protein [Bradyrhizobium sp. 180]MCK1493473.1 hypothetical protein [Bradyrhizobium sp. 180]